MNRLAKPARRVTDRSSAAPYSCRRPDGFRHPVAGLPANAAGSKARPSRQTGPSQKLFSMATPGVTNAD